MKITAFISSPKGKKSNTYIMAESFLAGAASAGAEVENVLLAGKEIKQCLGCLNCWIKTPGVCVHKDDMAELIGKFLASDIVVMATPLYVDNVSGIMKVFMDRLIPICDPHFVMDKDGECAHPAPKEARPKFVAMSSCGFPEQTHFKVVSLFFNRVARNMPTQLLAEIYRGQGNLLTIPSPMLRPVVEQYTALLEKAGAEIARDLKLSDATLTALEKPLIPIDMYISETNKYWDKMLAKIGKDDG